MFTRFYRGFRQAIKEDWESKTVDERKNIIRKQNENFDDDHKFSFESAGEDQFKDYPFVNLITPRYSSIVFTEGIPGSGKKFIFFYLDRKYEKYKEYCRLYEESYKELVGNNGEDCDVNPVITKEIKESLVSYSVEGETV